MQEICQSGSEGGAKLTFVPTPILNGGEPPRLAERGAFKPQTALLRRRPTVGVETWIPPEREKWSYTPGDSIYRIG